MSYVRNGDLTLGHVQRLALLCGYEVVMPTCGGVFAVEMPTGEIVEFLSLPAARRVLRAEVKDQQSEQVSSGGAVV